MKKAAARWGLVFIVITAALRELSDVFERLAAAMEDLPEIGSDGDDESEAA